MRLTFHFGITTTLDRQFSPFLRQFVSLFGPSFDSILDFCINPSVLFRDHHLSQFQVMPLKWE